MNEKFLHFLWKYSLFNKNNICLTSGENIEIVNCGEANTNAGADFFNARIKTEGTVWAGNVEIHVKSSDWNAHKHNTDKAYNNVILHVVSEHDENVYQENGNLLPTLVLSFPNTLFSNYQKLMQNPKWIACADDLPSVDEFYIKHWLSSLLVERLQNKAYSIEEKLQKNKNNWEETFYQQIARNFGFGVNNTAFEMLAASLPMSIPAKHKNNLIQIEALLFGQAGFLNEQTISDDYFLLLQREYSFLQKKYNLQPIENHLWKYLRLRPVNFPTVRIAQFAALIYQSSSLFSKIIETENIDNLKNFFDVQASEYWNTHYNFGKTSAMLPKKLGYNAFEILVINTIVPFLFVYGQHTGNQILKNRAVEFLESLFAEKNTIVNQWKNCGIKAQNAFESQALLQLKNEYCAKNRCLDCGIGLKIIQK